MLLYERIERRKKKDKVREKESTSAVISCHRLSKV
jgi:hypothetical protein